MDAERGRRGCDRMMAHAAKDSVGFSLIVVDALAVTPAMRGEVERHGVILLPIGCGTGGARRAIGIHGPGEVADRGILRVRVEHVGFGPFQSASNSRFLSSWTAIIMP